jgi:hypothetical protein
MRLKKSIICICACLLMGLTANAQFYSEGDDPARVLWTQGKTDHYNLIFPSGMDSLARIYATYLEQVRVAESLSLGMAPGQKQWGKTPVLLHAFSGSANAEVVWAPKRLSIHTLPEAYSPEPIPWEKELAIHESRHLAQMQWGYTGVYKPLGWLFGEMVPGVFSALYPGPALLEGDAVVAETALTNSGRGRTADFLSYYMMAWDNGDYRNWWRWRYGSNRYYSPSYYALGYVTVAGMRYAYDDPLFSEQYFEYVRRHPLHIGDMQKTARKISGTKFKETFRNIMETFHDIWAADTLNRAPFINSQAIQVTQTPARYTAYSGSVMVGKDLYALKDGIMESRSLVKISPDGKETRIDNFSANASNLHYSAYDNRLYWTEAVPDVRWSLEKTSLIRYLDLDGYSAGTEAYAAKRALENRGKSRLAKTLRKKADRIRYKQVSLTDEGRYFNPSPSPDGKLISATSYPYEGGTDLVIIDTKSGKVEESIPAPDSIRIVESAWIGKRIYMTGITGKGFGIYTVEGDWTTVLEPQVVKIQNFRSFNGMLTFTCDRSGVNELYTFEPESKTLKQITSTRYGADDFQYDEKGDTLFYSALTPVGKMVYKTPSDSMASKAVSMSDVHTYMVADALTRQEEELKTSMEEQADNLDDFSASSLIRFKAVKPYKKAHLPQFHSWAPLYFDYDNLQGASYDYDFQLSSLGATALYQNTLGTGYGFVGYSRHKDPYDDRQWRNAVRVKGTYSGFYPIVTASFSYNDREAIQHSFRDITWDGGKYVSTPGKLLTAPYIEGKVSIYVPFNFSKGGWLRGIIPTINYSISNDRFNTSDVMVSYDDTFKGSGIVPQFTGYIKDKNYLMQKLTASVRAYSVLPTASSQVYPRSGIGAEVGFDGRPGLTGVYSANVFGYMYGYLPGIKKDEGLRLTALGQVQLDSDHTIGENSVNTLPRGLRRSVIKDYVAIYDPDQLRFTADYAIPVCFGDISFLSPVVYIKDFVLTPHFDYTFIKDGGLFSTGASFLVRMANLMWFPYDCSAGITYSYNGGSAFDKLKSGVDADRHYLGFIFTTSL